MELARRVRDRLRPPEWFGPVVFGLGFYFAIVLVPKVWPWFAGTTAFALYFLSWIAVVAGLAVLAIAAVFDAVVSKLRREKAPARSYWMLALTACGFFALTLTIVISRNVEGALPTGSHLLEFDSTEWKRAVSDPFHPDEVSLRQKMLGGAVERLNPSLTRRDIEGLLGPSFDAAHFQDTGRDLFYYLGRQRDTIFPGGEWLLIWLDDDGKFERYAVYPDD